MSKKKYLVVQPILTEWGYSYRILEKRKILTMEYLRGYDGKLIIHLPQALPNDIKQIAELCNAKTWASENEALEVLNLYKRAVNGFDEAFVQEFEVEE